MKTKYLLLCLSALVVAGGLWFDRAAWRAHHQLVTLDVREVPLAVVLRKIEKQTWEKIRAEDGLDARITLRVKNKPLPHVLDRLAEQAGARWSAYHAVYDSAEAVEALDSALRGDGKLEPAGWTQMAPALPAAPRPRSEGETGFRSGANRRAGQGSGRVMIVRQGDSVVEVGPKGQVDVWSPEVLVVESSLKARLDEESIQEATAEAAASAARAVHGKWRTCYVFRQSSLGVGRRLGMGRRESTSRSGPEPAFRRGPNDQFTRLTPGQRVQRARQRLEWND